MSTVEILGKVILFLESFSALWGLCKLLQGRWNNWLAYLFISSVCWQPTSPGDLAYTQQVKQTGNYSVTFSPGCRSIADPRLRLFSPFFSKNSFLLYLLDLLLHIFHLSLLPGVCHVIIFQSHVPIYLEIWICTLHGKYSVGAMRPMLSGWVKYHNIWHCQL